jgi:ribokinase
VAGRVVVVGSSNIDLVMKMPRLPRVGETVTDATFVQAFGGKGANQAVGAARAGGEVSFVGCVGDDAYGAQVRGNLEADGIDTRFVFTEPGVASGTALILVGGGGENYMSTAPARRSRRPRS